MLLPAAVAVAAVKEIMLQQHEFYFMCSIV